MKPKIDELARVDPSCELAEGVEIGPFCVVGPGVRLGPKCRLISQCRIDGPSSFGAGNVFYPFSAVGMGTPDKKYRDEPTELQVGDNNIFRESVTVHRGTVQGSGVTKIGNGNLFMPCSHVAHDCVVGDDNTLVNFAGIAGHCQLNKAVTLAAHANLHQECLIGDHAFIGMHAAVTMDVPPFISVRGDPARFIGVNRVGMTRAGYSDEEISAVWQTSKWLFRRAMKREKALEKMDEQAQHFPAVGLIAEFVRNSQRGLVR